ncbi:MAG: FAD-dependent oxidoreductase, partial [Xanthomonadales bacterium]|nr:FAD-dependent oxidoreductase [Xanthomonadales bacterium]
VRRCPGHVELKAAGCAPERYDHVFFACHSDQALRILRDAMPLEREVLGAIEYQKNEAVLHTDAALMPRARRAWAAWNYHILEPGQDRAALTYNMNILQGLDAPVPFLVTLNNSDAIDPAQIIHRQQFSHPVFTAGALAAQEKQRNINGLGVHGAGRSWFCGAYWRYGFHEDGVVSAMQALEHFHERIGHEQRDIRRAS